MIGIGSLIKWGFHYRIGANTYVADAALFKRMVFNTWPCTNQAFAKNITFTFNSHRSSIVVANLKSFIPCPRYSYFYLGYISTFPKCGFLYYNTFWTLAIYMVQYT